jgi:hypothetical protein
MPFKLIKHKSKPHDLVHLGVGQNVYIANSSVEGAGRGVFAKKTFQRGDFITYYDAVKYYPTKAEENKITFHYDPSGSYDLIDSDGALYVGVVRQSKRYGDQKLKDRGVGQLINDSIAPCVTGKICNTKFYTSKDGRMYIKAISEIAENDELFVDYDYEYWRLRPNMIDNNSRNTFNHHCWLDKKLRDMSFASYYVTSCSHEHDNVTMSIRLYRTRQCFCSIGQKCKSDTYIIKCHVGRNIYLVCWECGHEVLFFDSIEC